MRGRETWCSASRGRARAGRSLLRSPRSRSWLREVLRYGSSTRLRLSELLERTRAAESRSAFFVASRLP